MTKASCNFVSFVVEEFLFFVPFLLVCNQTSSIIKHSGYDSSEAATKVVCAFLIYDERLGILC